MNAEIAPQRLSVRAQQALFDHGFTLHETLGVGGYSKVKLGRQGDRKVAVKIIMRNKAPQTYMEKFLPREIATMRRLSHPNIVQLFEVVELPDRVCLIMELATGGDLLEFINSRGFVSESESARLFEQLVSAVEYCHADNIVHRDLKCENILLDSEGCIKLTDFGFATTVPSGRAALNTHCGSYAYAAPEILYGESYDGTKSDAWSLGVVLYAMTVGRLPFNDCSMKVLLEQIQRPLELPLRLSRGLCDLLQRMLTVAAGDRATLTEVLSHPWLAGERQHSGDPAPHRDISDRVSRLAQRMQKLRVFPKTSPRVVAAPVAVAPPPQSEQKKSSLFGRFKLPPVAASPPCTPSSGQRHSRGKERSAEW